MLPINPATKAAEQETRAADPESICKTRAGKPEAIRPSDRETRAEPAI